MGTVKKLNASLCEIPAAFTDLPQECEQLVFVLASGWNVRTAEMRLLERRGETWTCVFAAPWPVDIGERGMARGRGLWTPEGPQGTEKREGDRRSPAGLFPLTEAFGYAPQPPPGCRLPYRQGTDRDYYIDDPASPDYNRWVRIEDGPNAPEKRWRSFERMRMRTDQYRLGVIVGYNVDPVVPGKGSCIFLHLWQAQGRGTAGCTAMAEGTMQRLLGWLDPARQPLLLQLPESVLPALRDTPVS